MASWVVVQLDTTPPSFSVDSISAASAGATFTVDFTISDGDASGVLHLPGGDVIGVVVGSQMSFDIPDVVPQGDYSLVLTATDDVDNSVDISYTLPVASEIEAVAAPSQAGAQDFTYGGGPWMAPFEQSVPGTVLHEKPFLFEATGEAILTGLPRLDQEVHGSVHLSAPFETSFAATRTEASRWSRLVNEDEEILLSL